MFVCASPKGRANKPFCSGIGFGDWALAGMDETRNVGGLRAQGALHTAVTLCLFTDRRISDDHPLRWLVEDDPRGWWGDGVDVRTDLGEDELGSLLWVLERAPLTVDIERWAKALAEEALTPLIRQGVANRSEVTATAVRARDRMTMEVVLFGQDGKDKYRQQFEIVWKQATA
jgi:phage gp46-like protein